MKKYAGLVFFCVYLLVSCNSSEIGNSKDVNPEAVYFDYKVWGDEEGSEMIVKLQYRFGGKDGTTLLLNEPSNVSFDDEPIEADSSKWDGAYYEVRRPVKDFDGKHTIIFTDLNRKQYKEEFDFRAISLAAEPPRQISRGDLVFELQGVDPEEYLHIMLSDTSFHSNGIDRIDTVKNGRLYISATDLGRLKNGPVRLEIYKEAEKKIKNLTPEGGLLSISYRVRREFELKD